MCVQIDRNKDDYYDCNVFTNITERTTQIII